MKEIDFYPEICEKFKKYTILYFPENTKVAYSYNKTLPQLIGDIEKELGQKSDLSYRYIPKLKLDILFGIKQEKS